MSTLKVDSILDTSGNDTVAGKIIQVQYTLNSTTSSQSISQNVPAAINNTSVDITPSSTSSKILLQAHWMGEVSGNYWNMMFCFLRGSTYLGAPVEANRYYGISAMWDGYTSANYTSTPEGGALFYVDSPATTSQITYHLGINGSAVTVYTNRTGDDTNAAAYERGVTVITAMEVAG